MDRRAALAGTVLLALASARGEVTFDFEGVPAYLGGEPGSVRTFEVYATIGCTEVREADADWSMSMTADGGRIIDMSLDGIFVVVEGGREVPVTEADYRDACPSQNCCQDNVLHVDDPNRHGAYTYVVCLEYPIGPRPMEPNVINRAAKLTVEVVLPPANETRLVTLKFEDGFSCEGREPAVDNIYIHDGGSIRPDVMKSCSILLGDTGPFRRGDANADGRVDIGDPVFALEYLFRSASAPPCERSADSNADGRLDLGDPIHLLRYLFADGVRPPDPFFECGKGPEAGTLSCDRFEPCR